MKNIDEIDKKSGSEKDRGKDGMTFYDVFKKPF